MPKIEVDHDDLVRLSGIPSDTSYEDLDSMLQLLKGELDSVDGNVVKIELNDTNRPDLWCTEGVARAIRCSLRGPASHLAGLGEPDITVRVDEGIREVRPFIACFRASGYALDEKGLEALISVQEKLTEAYGRKRSTAAIGFHRAREIDFPVLYGPAPPETPFHPLGEPGSMSLRAILEHTEKGRTYAHLLEGSESYPVLRDSADRPFSFPPVINSDTTGRVRPGDDDLFCDVTGTDWETVQLSATILACNLEDRGAVIEPVAVL